MEKDYVQLDILRSAPRVGVQRYQVPCQPGLTLLAALRQIAREQDATLAFRDNHCGRGVCTACLVRLDGRLCRACCSLLEGGRCYRVEPANEKVIRDLAVEL